MFLLTLTSCSPQYEVVQQLTPTRFHIIGVKNKEVIILETKLKLSEGQIVKWKDIKK